MRWDKKGYDLSAAAYIQSMDEKTTCYNNLIRKAERLSRELGGKPTNQEAQLYFDAVKVCEEIISMNLSNRAIAEQWKVRKLECEAQVKRITDILCPPPLKEPIKESSPTKDSPKKKEFEKAPTKTKSGFETQYASKDVPIEMIEGWFKEIPAKGFESVVGRTEIKEKLIAEAGDFGWDKLDAVLNLSPVTCYFLYGPAGSGKSFLINSFIHELSERSKVDADEEFNYIHLVGSEIHSKYVGEAETIVRTVFNVAVEHAPCFVFIDEIDNLCVDRSSDVDSHERRLTVAFMEAYDSFINSGKRLVFMGATNHPLKVDTAVRTRCRLIPIPLPAEEDRAVYFSRMINSDAKLFLEEGFTPEDMAAVTDNYGYRDMDGLKQALMAKIKATAIQEYKVLDDNGNVDRKASDERVSQAILSGEFKITREMFNQIQKENPPEDQSELRQELQEFESRTRKNP